MKSADEIREIMNNKKENLFLLPKYKSKYLPRCLDKIDEVIKYSYTEEENILFLLARLRPHN